MGALLILETVLLIICGAVMITCLISIAAKSQWKDVSPLAPLFFFVGTLAGILGIALLWT